MSVNLTVDMDRSDLLNTVKENRKNHKRIYHKAIDGYRKKCLEQLNNIIEGIQRGEDPELYVRLPRPEDHTDEYDVVLAMLNSSVRDVIQISYADYRKFALDQWDWKERWVGTTSSYIEEDS